MDGEDNYLQKKKGQCGVQNYGNGVWLVLGEENDLEDTVSSEKNGDLGDMTFCMANYVKEAMKMMFMMRSHHMLTDVILEVGSELFHAHKVILAAASPYFKVDTAIDSGYNGIIKLTDTISFLVQRVNVLFDVYLFILVFFYHSIILLVGL